MKKIHARDLRNQHKAEKIKKYSLMKTAAGNYNPIEDKGLNDSHRKKSKINAARAVGIKSTMYYNGKVIMSTYDNNSDTNTIVEKEILSDKVYNINTPGCYMAVPENGRIKATSSYYKNTTASVENPGNKRKPPQDLIHAKEKFELKYFGETFNDNIHIQIAYNIIDIEKILARYINTIVFSLNNIVMPDQNTDFVGNLLSTTDYNSFKVEERSKSKYKKFKRLYSNNRRLGYFASVFCLKDTYMRSDEEIYAILTFISQWRQFLFHQDQTASLYSVDDWITDDQRKIIFEIYKNHYDIFVNNFYGVNRTVIPYLTTILNINTNAEAKRFAERFYDFAAKKSTGI